MLGAIAGDIIGSPFEYRPIKTAEFPLFQEASTFTDDTVMTVATAHAILEGKSYAQVYRTFGRRYPRAGYGSYFRRWLLSEEAGPYNSWGNGSAMRVSPVGWAFETEPRLLREAQRTAEVTHNHPEGIKGAQAVALAIYMSRKGATKEAIRERIMGEYGYDLRQSLAELRPGYRYDISCQGSVPAALIAFLEAESFEQAVRNAISLGGDADTLACIAGAVAEAYFGPLPPGIAAKVRRRLTPDLLQTLDAFEARYGPHRQESG